MLYLKRIWCLNGKTGPRKCDGTGDDCKPCPVWTQVRLPTKIHKRFEAKPFLCGFCRATKTMSRFPKRDVFQENSLSGDISNGGYWTTWTAIQSEDFWCDWRVWRGCLSEGGCCCTKSRCCDPERKHQRVSQTTDSKTGMKNHHCWVKGTPNELQHEARQKSDREPREKYT